MAISYEATVWNDGDTITKDKMNKIEKGIETNSKEFGNYATRIELSDYIPNSAKGVSVATLVDGKVPSTQIPENLAKLENDNTFTGVNTFNGAVNVPEPIENTHAVNKEYVDNASVASAVKAEQDNEGNVIVDTYLKSKGTNRINGTLNIIPYDGENVIPENYFGIGGGKRWHELGFYTASNVMAIGLTNGTDYALAITPPTSDNT